MFCSEECKKEATNGYHRYECDVIDRILLVFNDFYKVIMVFRILFKALAICGGSVAEMKRVFTLNKKETILEFKYESHEFLSDPKEQLYASFAFNCNLLPWSLTRKKEETALYFKFLKLFPKLKSIWQNREESAFILLYLTIHARYAFSTESENSSQPEQWVGSAYPLRSFMQSSCLPNVVGYIYDRCSVVYRAQENLKAGSIITIQHASLMAEDWFYKRLYHFYECFDFICNCEACNKNFHPLISRKEFYKMKILAQRFKKGLDFTRPIIDDITNLDEYYDELQQVWEKEPNPAMVLKWFGIAIYNLSLRESLKISPYITKFDEIMDQTE